MSRLLDKIKKQSETPTVQMGFRRALPAANKPSILLIARVNISGAGPALKNIEGADAVLAESPGQELTVKILTKLMKPLGETPWGIYLEESADDAGKLEESGCDFLVLSPASPVATAPKEEQTGKIMQIESTMDDGLLRAVNDLLVDAVISEDVFGESDSLSFHHLMILRHLAYMVRKPLIVPVPTAISEDELKALWEAGIEAVLVPVDTAKDENLKELHDKAAKFPPRKMDKQKKINVSLPYAGAKQAEPEPDEEEEDDE